MEFRLEPDRNKRLFEGVEWQWDGGKPNVTTPPDEAVNIIGQNARKIVDDIPPQDRDEVTLTGGMAIWAYLVVFHAVLHTFRAVYYQPGIGPRILVARHG